MPLPTLEQYQAFEQNLFTIEENSKGMVEEIKPALEFFGRMQAMYQQQLGLIAAEAANTVKKYTTPGEDGKTYLDSLVEQLGYLLGFEKSVEEAFQRREGVADHALIKAYVSKEPLIKQYKEFITSQLSEYVNASQIYEHVLMKQYEEAMRSVNEGKEKAAQLSGTLDEEQAVQARLGKMADP